MLTEANLSVRSGYDMIKRTLSWQVVDSRTSEFIRGLRAGKYGTGYIYFADLHAHNILPHYLSMPSNQVTGKVGFDKFSTARTITTPDNNIGLPIQGATIAIPVNGWTNKFNFLVPEMSVA